MSSASRDFCRRAIAYLKVEEPPSDGRVAIELSESDSPVIRVLGHRLLAAYLVDEGESFAYVQHRHLAEAGLSEEDLHAVALQNLAALAGELVEVRSYGNIYAVLMGGNFEASLVLLDEFWSDWCSHLVPNGYVAAFPARDILAFGDSCSAEVINELNQLCQRGNADVDHPLTNTLYRRVGTSWLPLYG
jgi:uncharacterized protein YtpQ (UPF0354 family)